LFSGRDTDSNSSDQNSTHFGLEPLCSGDSQHKERGMKRDQPSPELDS
ncbi:putative MHC class I antigen protein, partial [Naja naja]